MSRLQFSKTIVEDGEKEGMFRRKPERYRLTGLPGQDQAEFIHGQGLRIFQASRQTLELRKISKWYQPQVWGLFPSMSDVPTGTLKLSRVTIHKKDPETRKKPNGNVELNGQSYVFYRLQPAVRTKLFRKDTWGHYRFVLRHESSAEFIEYNFRIDPYTGFKWRGSHRLFDGDIETNSSNPMLILAGFQLIELVFAAEAAQAATM